MSETLQADCRAKLAQSGGIGYILLLKQEIKGASVKLELLGIPNCNTVKKARTFLDEREVTFHFRDLRKAPLQAEEWRALVDQDKDGTLVNTRGPSFRKTGVPKDQLDNPDVVTDLLLNTPTAMKRPAVLIDGKLWGVGFKEEQFDQLVTHLQSSEA